MPSIFRKLDWLDKEDIIKRVVSLEFNRLIDYYKDADEIQVVDEHSEKSGKKKGKKLQESGDGFIRFFINLGRSDNFYPNNLIELVNKNIPGKIRIGKIDIFDNFSFFEVDANEAEIVLDELNGLKYRGGKISVEPAQDKKEGGKSSKPRRSSERRGRKGSKSSSGSRDRDRQGKGGKSSSKGKRRR